MTSRATGIPMEGMIPLDKLAAPATHSTTALRSYVPALDGVRGLAILVVMCCHFVWVVSEYAPPPDKLSRLVVEVFKSGRYGVDLFFVLSGFLITGILFDAKSDKHYFRNFYARRTLRIFPLYYCVLLIAFVVAPLFVSWNSPGERQVVHNQAWLWLYMGNVKNSFVGPEFFQQDRLWMGHFWSLAIEEQFYLVWPLLILLLNRRSAMIACVGMIVGAPLLRIGLMSGLPYPKGLFAAIYFTFCKLDTLALGALLALVARAPGGLVRYAKLAPWVFLLCGAMLAPMLFLKWDKASFMGAVSESAKLSTICFFSGSLLVLAVSSTPEKLVGWVFTTPIMRFFGKYSYGLYVFHELLAPLFNWKLGVLSLQRHLGGSWHVAMFLHMLLAGLISIGVSLVSWHVMEKHMLKLKRFFEHAPQPRPGKQEPTRAPEVPPPPDTHAPVTLQVTSGRLAG
jgi:peptidoglycan/LPS O-acetylase OafA/YrhL